MTIVDQIGLKWTNLDRIRTKGTELDQIRTNGHIRTKVDIIDRIETNSTKQDQFGPYWTGFRSSRFPKVLYEIDFLKS